MGTEDRDQGDQAIRELRLYQAELEKRNEELHQAREELVSTRGRYFDLYDLAPVGYCTLAEQGLILEVNLQAVTLLGASRSSLLAQPFTRFVLPEDHEVFRRQRAALMETGKPQAWDMRMLHADGSVLWAHLKATPAQDGEWRITFHDITERKQAEETLRASQEQYRTLVETTGEGIWSIDQEGRTTFANRQMAEMLGCTAEELRGKTIYDFLDDENTSKFKQHWERRAKGAGARYDLAFHRKDGSVLFSIVSGRALFDGQNQRVGGLAVVMDITGRKKMEDQLQSQLAELRSWQAVRLGSEDRVRELEHEVNELLACLGEPARYPSEEVDPAVTSP